MQKAMDQMAAEMDVSGAHTIFQPLFHLQSFDVKGCISEYHPQIIEQVTTGVQGDFADMVLGWSDKLSELEDIARELHGSSPSEPLTVDNLSRPDDALRDHSFRVKEQTFLSVTSEFDQVTEIKSTPN